MNRGPLGVSDDDFWQNPFRNRAAVIDRLARENLTGFVLDAPSVVRADRRDDVPLAGVRRELLSHGHGAAFRERAVLTVVRLDSNVVLAARAFQWKEPAVMDSEPVARAVTQPLLDAVMTDFFLTHLRKRFPDLPWREGTLLVTLLVDDDRSNTVRVRIEGAPGSDPAVQEFIARHRSPGYPRMVNPAPKPKAGAPLYQQQPESPPSPSLPGVSLVAPERVELTEGARCIVRGSFSLPVIEREIVKPFDAHLDRFGTLHGAGHVDVGDRDARAVVPITLVVTAERVEEPAVLRLDVPVYDDVSPGQAGAPVHGFFTVDLLALPSMFRLPGKYRVWALSGDVLVGPRAIELSASG